MQRMILLLHRRLLGRSAVLVGMRMRVVMVVMMIGAAAHMMVMPLLRRADRVLIADDPGAVFAQLAVHLRAAPAERVSFEFADAVDKDVDHARMVAQIARL